LQWDGVLHYQWSRECLHNQWDLCPYLSGHERKRISRALIVTDDVLIVAAVMRVYLQVADAASSNTSPAQDPLLLYYSRRSVWRITHFTSPAAIPVWTLLGFKLVEVRGQKQWHSIRLTFALPLRDELCPGRFNRQQHRALADFSPTGTRYLVTGWTGTAAFPHREHQPRHFQRH